MTISTDTLRTFFEDARPRIALALSLILLGGGMIFGLDNWTYYGCVGIFSLFLVYFIVHGFQDDNGASKKKPEAADK